MTEGQKAPVITIDGPSGTGKGTLALRLADELKFAYLDSGALYRALAWAVTTQQIKEYDGDAFEQCINQANVRLGDKQVWCNGHDVSLAIRQEAIGNLASTISANPLVRKRLLQLQRAQRHWPGLITDGRDMGTVVFPEATVKIFLTASAEARAKRRYNQLKTRGIDVSLREIEADLNNRDEQDRTRSISPLQPASDAIHIDTTQLDSEAVFDLVMKTIKPYLNCF